VFPAWIALVSAVLLIRKPLNGLSLPPGGQAP